MWSNQIQSTEKKFIPIILNFRTYNYMCPQWLDANTEFPVLLTQESMKPRFFKQHFWVFYKSQIAEIL